MEKEIILHSTSKCELKELFAETLKEELAIFFGKDTKSDNRLRTRKEVGGILGISLPTLHTWTKEGTIKAVRIGNSVRYKMEDIEQALQQVKSIKYMRGRTTNNCSHE